MSTLTKEVMHIWDGCTGGPEDGMDTHTWDKEDPMGHLEGNEYLQQVSVMTATMSGSSADSP